MFSSTPRTLLIGLVSIGLIGCKPAPKDDTDIPTDTGPQVGDLIIPTPDRYRFPSRDNPEVDSVAYEGQIFRHLLIGDLKAHMAGFTDRLNGGLIPEEGEIVAELEFYFEFDSAVGGPLAFSSNLNGQALQTTYDDVGTGKDLVGKLAGNDPIGQHKDWSTEMVGWTAAGVSTPESLVRSWFDQLESQAIDWSFGNYPLDPSGSPVAAVYITPEGHDLRQLTQKFLDGAIAFSQGADDYLDDDEPGKGLLSDHSATEEGKPYTTLERAWDEGFGYFGPAREYPLMTDEQIAQDEWFDSNGDGAGDLFSEVCWGHSINAAKRDLDSSSAAPNDFTAQAWSGFYEGRLLLAETRGPLSPDELETLKGHRDTALDAWEKAIAATMVVYINDVIRDMGTFDTADYDFGSHATHWSELKGFALSLQFNPRMAISEADYITLHEKIGQAPVLPTADLPTQDAYIADLLAARAILGTSYGFDPANLGDENGENGW